MTQVAVGLQRLHYLLKGHILMGIGLECYFTYALHHLSKRWVILHLDTESQRIDQNPNMLSNSISFVSVIGEPTTMSSGHYSVLRPPEMPLTASYRASPARVGSSGSNFLEPDPQGSGTDRWSLQGLDAGPWPIRYNSNKGGTPANCSRQ